jgi:hypothetical protein
MARPSMGICWGREVQALEHGVGPAHRKFMRRRSPGAIASHLRPFGTGWQIVPASWTYDLEALRKSPPGMNLRPMMA